MKFQSFLIKYAEIGVKGKNRYLFEDMLVRQIRYALKPVEGDFVVSKESGRIYVKGMTDFDYEGAIEAMSRVFGISGICPMVQVDSKGVEDLYSQVLSYIDETYPDKHLTFKVETRRANKGYPLNSTQLNAGLGEAILKAYPDMKVDVHSPDVLLRVEIRDKVNLYSKVIKGPGGMPVGTGGKAMLLLSGGIDSPVAGYMMAKRGVKLDAVYFHAPPYTSERAKQKVVDLARQISKYCGPINLHVVNFTDVQLYIYDKCPHDQLTVIMRRYMMKLAEHFAYETQSLGLVTGESIGQVASQTMASMAVTNEVCTLPVYRPLIAFDKQDIIDVANKIETFETSILPYEDCCTVFVPKHPVTKPTLKSILKSESHLTQEMESLVEKAIGTTETIWIKA